MVFGKHLILDISGCDLKLIKSRENLQQFVDRLCADNGMQKVGETIFKYFEDNEFNREKDIVGFTILQIISLSSITIHICEGSLTAYIDFFTCGELHVDDVKKLVKIYFNPKRVFKKLIERDALKIS